MHRFKTKKKAKDDASAGRSSEDSEHSSLPFKVFGRKKQPQEEVKKEFDLSTALPSTDDFRTSLLMANLSARFSMLREQDDPNTKIGKASDDSVLYPKRQSRLADFGFGGANGLTDIAEVESIKAAPYLRTNSFASDDADMPKGASVMTRAKPTEGNNLFGGRQKIYKIPAGSKSANGGLPGKALYDDDVAMSAFQRWRLAERERSYEEQNNASTEEEQEQERSESPPPIGYNRKRETSSTTSSASITARNSTAATSITSQAATAVKDTQSPGSASNPAPERMVTRTRRLYEQGLGQENQDQQASALSRFESLTRQRPLATNPADKSIGSTPQAGSGSSRVVLTKASAPNLRSTSPTAHNPLTRPLELGIKVQADPKPNPGGVPPLSPPISETGDLALFQKPAHPYDESQYVQLQKKLQQGRETPTQRQSTESDMESASRSRNHEGKPVTGMRPGLQEDRLPPTPVTDTDSATAANLPNASTRPNISVERPSDMDHPAFRQSAIPTPLSIGAKATDMPLPSPKLEVVVDKAPQSAPVDSPTLGPVSGLSGLVRQHLRTESLDSFMDLPAPEAPGSGFVANSRTGPVTASELESKSNLWSLSGQDSTSSTRDQAAESELSKADTEPQHKEEFLSDSRTPNRSSDATDDMDEFANQLAEARRRVREKLTSFIESDSSRAPSPLPPSDLPKDSSAQASPNALGIGLLKPKSSRGSLVDRSRTTTTSQSKGLKLLGIGGGTMSSPPQRGEQSSEEKESLGLETMKEEGFKVDQPSAEAGNHNGSTSSGDKDEEATSHPGLRAFRQARRELQRHKELELLARRQTAQTSQSPEQPIDGANVSPRPDRGPRQRTPSRERRPPPITYRQRAPSDEHGYNSSAADVSSGRDRSGSETSGGRSNSRPPRLRTNTASYEQLAPGNSRQPVMRSPGLPGTDIKGSPLMPPYPYPGRGVPSPAPSPHSEWQRSAGNLAVHAGRPGFDSHSGQPSPISPMGLPSPAPFATGPVGSPVGTPTSLGPRPRQASASQSPALGPSSGVFPPPMRRPIDKRDISEPTPMPASRIPTPSMSQQPPHPQQPPPMVPERGNGTRSRSNSRGQGPAPPVPPINPRRRRDDSRAHMANDDGGLATPRLPFANQANNSTSSLGLEDNRSVFSISDDDNNSKPSQRRRLQKPNPNMPQAGARPFGKPRDTSPPFVAKGPPASRTMATSGMGSKPGMGMPGGMI